jgi:hypothetical protein
MGLAQLKDFPIFKISSNLQIQIQCLPKSKFFQTLHEASFEHDEQLPQLDQLQIPKRIRVINFRIDSNLNFP